MKKCPFCAEKIKDKALKCRYCGEFLPEYGTYLEKERLREKEQKLLEQEIAERKLQDEIKIKKQAFKYKQNEINKKHFDNIHKIYKGTKYADMSCDQKKNTLEGELSDEIFRIISYSFGIGFSRFDFQRFTWDSAIYRIFDMFAFMYSARYVFDLEGRVNKINYKSIMDYQELEDATFKYHPFDKYLDEVELIKSDSAGNINKHVNIIYAVDPQYPNLMIYQEGDGLERRQFICDNSDYFGITHDVINKQSIIAVDYLDSGYFSKFSLGKYNKEYDNEYNEDGMIIKSSYIGMYNTKHEISIFHQNNRITNIERTYYEKNFDGSWDKELASSRKEMSQRFYSSNKLEKMITIKRDWDNFEIETELDYDSKGRLKSVNTKKNKIGLFGRKKYIDEINSYIKYRNN